MANKSTAASSRRKYTDTTKATEASAESKAEALDEAAAAEKPKAKTISEDVSEEKETASKPAQKKQFVAKDVDLHQFVTVRNGFQGRLVYISKRTGERFVWDGFGSEQDMELGELRSARNSSRDFFANNWFMFDDPWVIDFLGVGQYYKYTVSIDNFDDLFDKSIAELEEIIPTLSRGQKQSIAYRARQLVVDGTIDSNKLIAALERLLGVELIER